jgi:hypothetical protein
MVLGVAEVAGAVTASAVEFFQQMAGRTVDGLLHGTLIDDIWKSL